MNRKLLFDSKPQCHFFFRVFVGEGNKGAGEMEIGHGCVWIVFTHSTRKNNGVLTGFEISRERNVLTVEVDPLNPFRDFTLV